MSSLTAQLTPRQEAGGPPIPLTPEGELEDNTIQLLALVGTLYGLALLAMLLRAWVRIRILKAFGKQAKHHRYVSSTTMN